MIYGLYLSAAGVMSSSHRQDVIANNLANAETAGFRRSLALFQQRPAESAATGNRDRSDALLDEIGGGLFVSPTRLDLTRGTLERSDSPLHLAITGDGYFGVKDGTNLRLSRNGNLMLDRKGTLILAGSDGSPVVDVKQKPLTLDPTRLSQTTINPDGTIVVDGEFAGQIGVFNVADPRQLVPAGGTLLAAADPASIQLSKNPRIEAGFLESSNVDPATELTQLLETQRQLEANANMIRYQDQTLGRLVNDVGKIS